jgi:hypothetical protein
MKDIVFICGARDFHAMDKYWITAKAVYPRKVLLLTDLIESENQPKLIAIDTSVHHLFNIDKLLFKKQSSISNIWRNLIKLLLIPVQIYYLKKFYKNHSDYIYHAIPMYYMMLCYLANVPFVATPQGSEILVRPLRSKIYKKFAVKSLKAARNVIVDSVNMQNKVFRLSGVKSIIMKNGFNTSEILNKNMNYERQTILSIRGFNPIYRIEKILEARLESEEKLPISFVYPACEEDYKKRIKGGFIPQDKDLGRLDKSLLYEEMVNTLLAISIPESDSSPRSVYECIFAGACVAVTQSPYIKELPKCMIERIYLVNIDDRNWFDEALVFAKKITSIPFIPSDEALEMCDQERTIKKIVDRIYSE